MLVLPAAAAPAGQGTVAKVSTVDQGLKEDLWANHQQYRLQAYDMNVQRATSVISILNKYGIDTTACTGTLSTISGKRSALEAALTKKDREGLKTVNADLRTLWQQFRTQMRDAIRDHYSRKTSSSSIATATADLAADTV
jgi:spore germination protein YaaH